MAFIAMEFWGKGDPMFGGEADDRPLGKNGQFLRRAPRAEVAEFPTKESALAAAAVASRRPDSTVGAFERAEG